MYINATGAVLAESAASTNQPTAPASQLLRRGTAANDIFHSAAGQVMEGGAGDDWYHLWNASWTVNESAGQGVDTIVAQYWGAVTLPNNVENLILNNPGSTAGTGNALENIIKAGNTAATLDGRGGNDVLVGGAGADLFVVAAGNGSDAIVGFKPSYDAVRLDGYGISNMTQLLSVAKQVAGDVQLNFANGEILVLRDVQLSALQPHDFGFLAAVQTPAANQSLLSYASNVGIANGWFAHNNVWGKGSLVERTDFVLTGVYDKNDITSGTTFTWSFPFSTEAFPQVRAYPELFFGVSPYGNPDSNPTDKANTFPIKVEDLKSAALTHDLSYDGQSVGFNIAYDIWFTSVPNGNASKISTELMIWLHAGSAKPFGEVIGSIDAGGLSGKIYHSGTYVAVVADREIVNTTLDLVAIIDALQTFGLIKDSEYLAAIELGSEVFFGSGSLKFNNMEFTVEAATADGSVIKHVTAAGAHVETRTSPVTLDPSDAAPPISAPESASIPALLPVPSPATATQPVTTTATVPPVAVTPPAVSTSLDTPPVTPMPSAGAGLSGNVESGGSGMVHLAQQVHGTQGNDVIYALGNGPSTLVGYEGNDVYAVRDINDVIVEVDGGGNDIVYSSISYTLNGGAAVENLSTQSHSGTESINLIGNSYAQQMIGNFGDNVINGNGGADTLIGLKGDDIYSVGDASAVVREAVGEGCDIVFAQVSYALNAGAEVETLSAASHRGTASLDLTGNEFAQQVIGNFGANVLDGGAGADTLIGLQGADTFRFSSALGAGNVDTIADFEAGVDRIALASDVFTGLAQGPLSGSNFFVGTAATTADQHIIYNQATGQLYFDVDGSGAGAAVLFATVTPGTGLGFNDFQVISATPSPLA